MKNRLVATLLLLGLATPIAWAQRNMDTVDARTVSKNVRTVMKVYDWRESLAAAQAEARKKHKMVFYLQMVGEIDGGL